MTDPHPAPETSRNRTWTLIIVSLGLFMVVLDNLVVNTALPSIRRDLGASIQSLEWTVNAYVLAYAVLLLTGSALGERFGRKRMFMAGIAIFTVASAAAALAPSAGLLIAARAAQGLGAAIATPLTLTLLADAFPPDSRGLALGVWSGISGVAVALGPLVGGAVIQLSSWHWIFWINVPIGAALVPLAGLRLRESYGTTSTVDLRGLALSGAGLFGIVFGLVRSQSLGWGAPTVVISLAAGVVLLVLFAVVELRTREPMLPLDFFARRSFAVTNVVSLAMYFGMFGSIFFLSQFLQNVLHNSPAAGRRQAAGVDGRDDARRPAGGLLLRARRQPAVHGRGTGAAGTRAGLAGHARDAGPELREHGDPVRAGRRRNGAHVRPLGQRGAGVGARRSGRPGLGRHERDPRARRRAGDLGARHRVHEQRELRQRTGVRQRPDPGPVGRDGGPRGRRADRARAAVQQPRRGAGPSRRRAPRLQPLPSA